jgi:hypothetical protein
MAGSDIASAAFERAWNVYRLVNKDIDENDVRRALLERFILQRCAAGDDDPELLAVEGLKYLKKYDGS